LYGDLPAKDITDEKTLIDTNNLTPHASRVFKIQVYPKPEEVLFMQD